MSLRSRPLKERSRHNWKLKGRTCASMAYMMMLSARVYFLLLLAGAGKDIQWTIDAQAKRGAAVHAQLPVGTVTTTLAEAAEGVFLQALTNDSVTEILVTPQNFVLSRNAWSVYSNAKPYRLTRDVVIKSASKTAGQLDFQFLSGKVLIGEGVTVTLENLVVRNIRKLGGFSLDFFVGDTNSTVVMRNVVRAKVVCNPISEAYKSAKSFSNLPGFPPNNVSILDSLCILAPNWTDQVCYDNTIHFTDMAFLVRNTDPDAGLSWPGYVLYMTNTSRVCDNYITAECYASLGQDTCTADLLNRLLNSTQGFVWTPGRIAGVAVAAGVVVVAIVLCCVFRKRILLCLVKSNHKSLQELESNRSPTVDGDGTPRLTMTPSNPNKKSSVAQTVRLGVLLGSGSFGRVYRGRWHGTDVAVKIISCTPDELSKVLKEAEVMMQLHHPNVVRAHQCSVWNPAEQQRALQASKKGAGTATSSQRAGSRRPTAGGSSQPTNSTISMMPRGSTGRGSSATAAAGSRGISSVVISIMPDIVMHPRGRRGTAGNDAAAGGRRGAAARQAAAAAAPGSGTVSSSHDGTLSGPTSGAVHPQSYVTGCGAATAAGTAASTAAAAAAAGGLASSSSASVGSSMSAAAWQLLSKVLHPVAQHQQRQQEAWAQQQQQQQGPQAPSTRSWSHEGDIHPHGRFAGTPLTSAAPTLTSAAGSSGGTLSASAGHHHPLVLMLPVQSGDRGAASSTSVAGYLNGTSSSAGQQLAPVLLSHGLHSAPLGESRINGSCPAAELGAWTAATADGSTGTPVLLPVVSGVPYAAGSALTSASAVSRTGTAMQQSSGGGEARDGSSGWWGANSWRQQVLQDGAGSGSASQTRHTLRSSDGAAQPQQQQLLSSGASVMPGRAAGAAVDPGSSRASGIQSVASSWWRRGKQGTAGSTADSQAIASSSSAAARANQQEVALGSDVIVIEGAGQLDDELDDDASSEEGRTEVQVWLVLELCTGGTLKDAVSMGKLKSQGRLEMAKLLCRLLDAATGMAYLHGKGVLHGDLKAGNVLLQSTIHGTYGQVAKIADFGLAATLLDGATHRSTASMGTITHMAPEVLRSGHMSAAGDVYSFGIMMWEVYTNAQAHQGMHSGVVVERVVVRGERPAVPPDMPSEYSLLMRSCWDGDAAKRPTFAQVMQCLELLLDNLTSDSDGRSSDGSEGHQSSSSNASGGNASSTSVTVEELLARKSEPAAAAAAPSGAMPAATAYGQTDSGGPGSSSAAVASADVAAGRPGGVLSSGRWPAALGSSLGAATPGTSQPLDQPQQLQLVTLSDKGLSAREPSAPATSNKSLRTPVVTALLLDSGLPAGKANGGTWSSTLGGSGSMGSTLGVPVTPQQPTALQQQQQHGAWQQVGRLQLRVQQEAGPSSSNADEVYGLQLVQDL